MSHELVEFPNGSYSVMGPHEPMHSHIGAWEEAQAVYVRPSGLAAALGQPGPALVLYDLGMGLAANALAAIECFRASRPRRDLRVISFENELGAAALGLEKAAQFPWLARNHEATAELLAHGHWSEAAPDDGPVKPCSDPARLSWHLCAGDFLERDLEQLPAADLLFFDFYSPKADPRLWGLGCFAKLRAACTPSARLYTYGSSTAARAAMLLAGFCVGASAATEAKKETTEAALALDQLARPLGRDWLERLRRSDRPLPSDIAEGERGRALDRIERLSQFTRNGGSA